MASHVPKFSSRSPWQQKSDERLLFIVQMTEAATGLQSRSSGASYRLLSLRDALKLIFRGTETSHSSCYKVISFKLLNLETKSSHNSSSHVTLLFAISLSRICFCLTDLSLSFVFSPLAASVSDVFCESVQKQSNALLECRMCINA